MTYILVLVYEGCIKYITDKQVFTNRLVVLDVNCYVSNQVHFLLYLQEEPVLHSFKFISPFFWIICNIFATQSINFNIWLVKGKSSFQLHTLDSNNLRIQLRSFQQSLKISYILYLTWLCHSIAIRSETPLGIKFHNIVGIFEGVEKQEHTANDSACPSLAVVAVEHCYPLIILI
jgi:hypothetical protein